MSDRSYERALRHTYGVPSSEIFFSVHILMFSQHRVKTDASDALCIYILTLYFLMFKNAEHNAQLTSSIALASLRLEQDKKS